MLSANRVLHIVDMDELQSPSVDRLGSTVHNAVADWKGRSAVSLRGHATHPSEVWYPPCRVMVNGGPWTGVPVDRWTYQRQ